MASVIKNRVVLKPQIPANSLVGLGLFVLLFFLIAIDFRWDFLFNLQQNETYKQISGLLILACFYIQWQLVILRINGLVRYKSSLQWHKWSGSMTPLLFYVHASGFGYGYQSVLAVVFLTNTIIGLLNPHSIPFRATWYYRLWLFWHLSLASVTLILLAYHIYIAFTYS